MNITFFNTKPYDQQFLTEANHEFGHGLEFLEVPLTAQSAVLARGEDVCVFVNDVANAEVLRRLAAAGVRVLALRCASFNNVDLKTAAELRMVVRVPAYSPYAVAEYTLALILMLNCKTYRAYSRVREGNFALTGLMGFDLHGRTVGLVGLGKNWAGNSRHSLRLRLSGPRLRHCAKRRGR